MFGLSIFYGYVLTGIIECVCIREIYTNNPPTVQCKHITSKSVDKIRLELKFRKKKHFFYSY